MHVRYAVCKCDVSLYSEHLRVDVSGDIGDHREVCILVHVCTHIHLCR